MSRRFVIKSALIIGGTLLLIDAAIMAVVANFNSGVIITSIAALVLLLCGVFFNRIFKIKWFTYSFGIGFILSAGMIIFIAVYGKADNVTFTEDAVIVLGAGIKGEQVTLPLAYRLDKAVDYHKKNPNALIILSGGQGFQESITEALAMERYLLNRGVTKDKIIKEEESTSTYTNLVNSKKILDGYFDDDYIVALITNDFHIFRTTSVAKKIGLDSTHYHAKIKWYTIPTNYLRECAAIAKTWILGT